MPELFAAFSDPKIQLAWSSSTGRGYDPTIITVVFDTPIDIDKGSIAVRSLTVGSDLVVVALYRNIEVDVLGRDGGFRVIGLSTPLEADARPAEAIRTLFRSFIPQERVTRPTDLLGGVVETTSAEELAKLVSAADARLKRLESIQTHAVPTSVPRSGTVIGYLSVDVGDEDGVRPASIAKLVEAIDLKFAPLDISLAVNGEAGLSDADVVHHLATRAGKGQRPWRTDAGEVAATVVRSTAQDDEKLSGVGRDGDQWLSRRARILRAIAVVLAPVAVAMFVGILYLASSGRHTPSTTSVPTTSSKTAATTASTADPTPTVATTKPTTGTPTPGSDGADTSSDLPGRTILNGEVGDISKLAATPNMELMAAAGPGGVAVVATDSGVSCEVESSSAKSVRSLEFSPVSNDLMIADREGLIRLVSPTCVVETVFATGSDLTSASFSTDGGFVFVAHSETPGHSASTTSTADTWRLTKWRIDTATVAAERSIGLAPDVLIAGQLELRAIALRNGKTVSLDEATLEELPRKISDFPGRLSIVSTCQRPGRGAIIVGIHPDGSIDFRPEQPDYLRSRLSAETPSVVTVYCTDRVLVVSHDNGLLEANSLSSPEQRKSIPLPSVVSVTAAVLDPSLLAVGHDGGKLTIFDDPNLLHEIFS